MPREIVEKKFPFRHAPQVGHFVIVKANHESGNEVEFTSQIGQWDERLHAPDNATDAQHPCAFAEHGKIIEIDADDFLSAQVCDVCEGPGGAAALGQAVAGDNPD